MKYDVIIVGARCGGSPLAMHLARRGYRVLVIDRTRFPSDKLSTHALWQIGVAALKRWGLLDKLLESRCPKVYVGRIDAGDDLVVKGVAPPVDGIGYSLCPRRNVLDKILVDAAVDAGAELREGCQLRDLVRDGDRVVGIEATTSAGTRFREHARVVIGADGMRSKVARCVRAPIRDIVPTLLFWCYSYWSGIEMDGFEWYPNEGRFVLAFPTHDGLINIAIGGKPEDFPRLKGNMEEAFLEMAHSIAPTMVERMRAGKREERYAGSADLPNFVRRSSGQGWALVGDAGYHKDPVTGQGMLDAFIDSEILADAIDASLARDEPLDDALARYERTRNDRVLEMYRWTCLRASGNPGQSRKILSWLREDQERANRFFGIAAGSVRASDLFPQLTEELSRPLSK